ncbi:TetR/AcrR family transcriptional regulator [Globicatella sulfidifaciens]
MTIDRRILKTKEAIRKALINLLDNNEIENISATEIAQEADITRKTFYTYYNSYEKLIDELENDLIEMFEKPINKMEFSESAFNPQLIFETLTDLVRENLEFYQHFMLW